MFRVDYFRLLAKLTLVCIGFLLWIAIDTSIDIRAFNEEQLRISIGKRQKLRQEYRMNGIEPGNWPNDSITKAAIERGIIHDCTDQ